jgi:signal transduction histidine kinase
MRATKFWSVEPPAAVRGYPIQLPVAVCSVAILTCMLANGLLAHSATLSRNKLAEIVWTRRELWRMNAQKENAEAAAAARTKFIALASHEIRTPLHHLQGYGDLLSRTDLNNESRQLLMSMQNATKTLALSKSSSLLS